MGTTSSSTGGGSGLVVRVGFVAVAVAALVLGYVGLHDHLAERPAYGTGVLDIVYWDLQLFVLDSAPLQEGGELPVALQIARFAAPAATAYALFTTAYAVLGQQIRLTQARRSRRHTVICGLVPATAFLARQLVADGRPVVVVDPGLASSTAALAVSDGTLRVVGDPRDSEVLRQAGAAHAHEVMALTPDSAFNAEVALTLRASATPTATPTCYVQVDDRELSAELAARTLTVASSVRVEFFSRHDRAARRLLDRHPVADDGTRRPAVLVVGGGPLAQAVVVELARRHQRTTGADRPPLPVHVADGDGTVAQAFARLPLPPGVLSLSTGPDDLALAEEPSDLAIGDGPDAPAPTHVVVCLDDDAAAMGVGLRLARALTGEGVQIVVAATTSTVFGRVVGVGTVPSTEGSEALVLHNVTETVYLPDAVRHGDVEDIARAIHDAYLAACRARGETSSSTVSWDRLPGFLKDDNRAQAADIGRKLAAIGAAIVPASGHDEPFALTDSEVGRLARMEHERWLRRRREHGWTDAPERDPQSKQHPDMVGWADLTNESRDKDRSAVREIPALLRAAGFAIVRGTPAG